MTDEKKKVLVVEDNMMNTVLVREILTLSGYQVLEAKSGTEAIKVLTSERPDIILMDLHLPEMDGVTATRIIRSSEKNKDIPILALTASVSSGDEDKCIGKGFDGCVPKPIDRKKLLEAIGQNLKKAG